MCAIWQFPYFTTLFLHAVQKSCTPESDKRRNSQPWKLVQYDWNNVHLVGEFKALQ